MENKMFFENEKNANELVTPLTEEQFGWLYSLLDGRYLSIELKSNPSIIDANTIGEIIKRIRKGVYLRSGSPFDITDEELTFLISRYGYLVRTVTVSGRASASFQRDLTVPLDTDIEDLENTYDDGWYEYGLDEYVDVECDEIYDVGCDNVVTTMKFKLPTPTTFGFTDEMKEVA
ncbi:hypothetical protein OAN58_02410 [Paracoccaceae bacterium]|nr:hypothetical protein [Paracoccaceae bacterium]